MNIRNNKGGFVMNIRYYWNIIIGTRRRLLKAGDREEKCPHCGRVTPVRYKIYWKTAACLWCGEHFLEYYCEICKEPFGKGELIYTEPEKGIYGAAHRECLPE